MNRGRRRAMDRSGSPLRARGVALFTAVIVLTGCVSHPGLPATTDSAYRRKVVLSADAAISSLATVALALDGEATGRTTARYLDQVVSAQEELMSGVAGSFGSITPPTDDAVLLHDRVVDLLGEAEDHLADVRIALRRGGRADLRGLREELEADVDALSGFGSP